MDPRIILRARSQYGVFTAAQAVRLGATSDQLRRARERGEVQRVRRNAFVLGEDWKAADPDGRYRLRTRAVLLSLGRHAWASHHAALVLAGVDLWRYDHGVVDVLVPSTRVRLAAGVRKHPRPAGLEPRVFSSFPAVPPAFAAAQFAVRDEVDPAVVATDSVLRAGLATVDSIRQASHLLAPTPRQRARVDTVLAQADPLSESVGESRARCLLFALGFAPRSQVDLRDAQGFIGRVDFLVGGVVVEFDGMVKYAGADGRAALAAEKAREDRLRAAGYEVVRLVWSDLEDPLRVARLVRSALARAAQRRASTPA